MSDLIDGGRPMDNGYHRCGVNGCTRAVPQAKLMCLGHWRRVPQDLRFAVEVSYRRRRSAPQGERLAAVAAWRKAAAAALAWAGQVPA
jgi:hypothetical protein